MADEDLTDLEMVLQRIQNQANERNMRLTVHAQQEMIEESIKIADIYQTLAMSQILEYYPEHQRGACCLLGGQDEM